MDVKSLIGRKIKDIFVWSNIEDGGLEEARVYIELYEVGFVSIPWVFDSQNIQSSPKEKSKSIFSEEKNTVIYSVNKENKSINEILALKEKRSKSIIGRLKRLIGVEEVIPKEYQSYKKDYIEDKVYCIKNQKIVNFFMFDDFDSVGFLELENGYIITETIVAPYGTGMAGLNYFENIKEFEAKNGTGYKRLIN